MVNMMGLPKPNIHQSWLQSVTESILDVHCYGVDLKKKKKIIMSQKFVTLVIG